MTNGSSLQANLRTNNDWNNRGQSFDRKHTSELISGWKSSAPCGRTREHTMQEGKPPRNEKQYWGLGPYACEPPLRENTMTPMTGADTILEASPPIDEK